MTSRTVSSSISAHYNDPSLSNFLSRVILHNERFRKFQAGRSWYGNAGGKGEISGDKGTITGIIGEADH